MLFYARALDLSILTAVRQLSSYQSNPTQLDLTAAYRLLNYVSSHPIPSKTIHPSSVALWACTDASYLSRPKSGSVAGCSVGLGDPPPYLLNPPPESRRQSLKEKQSLVRASRLIQSHPSHPLPFTTPHNAPLHAFCQRIPVVVASVAEAEYAAAFGGEQVLAELYPCSPFPPLRRDPTHLPTPAPRLDVGLFKSFVSCIYSCLCSCLT